MNIKEITGLGLTAKTATFSVQDLIMLKTKWQELMTKAEVVESTLSTNKHSGKAKSHMEDLAIDLTDFDIFFSKLTEGVESEQKVYEGLFGTLDRNEAIPQKELHRIDV